MLVRTLTWLNTGFDCASWNEISFDNFFFILNSRPISHNIKKTDQAHAEFDNLRKVLLDLKTKSAQNAVSITQETQYRSESQKMISFFTKYILGINYLNCDSVEEMHARLEHGTLSDDGFEGQTMEQRKIGKNNLFFFGQKEKNLSHCFSAKKVYAHPCKLKHQIKQAMDITVGYTTLDNLMEIEKISKIQKEEGKKLRVLLRIATHDEDSRFSFSTKYGAPLDTVDSLIKKCYELGVEIAGCSFHVGTGCPTPQPFITALKDCKNIFEKVKAMTNNQYDPKVVDIGGGFWGHSAESFFLIANPIRPVIDQLFPAAEGFRVIAEPGRFFATRCTTLVTELYSIREIQPTELNNPDNLNGWCYLNDSMYHSLNNINFDSYVFNPIIWRQAPRQKGKFKYKVFGCTCDSLDVISKCYETDEELGEGGFSCFFFFLFFFF